MRLLKLPQQIQDALMEGSVTEGQVRPLIALPHDSDKIAIFKRIIEHDLSARQVEQLLREKAAEPKEKTAKPANTEWKQVERSLTTFLGAKTVLQRKKKGGKLTVSFQSEEDLTRILDVFGFRLDS
jgi:ParB family chromosome partitioning protein